MVAAHDVGKAVNPLSCEGQIEGGVVMSLGYALTEQYPIDVNCKPTAKYGMLGLFRANQIPPEIQAIVVEKPGLKVAGGAIGIGEITSIPTAPAIAAPPPCSPLHGGGFWGRCCMGHGLAVHRDSFCEIYTTLSPSFIIFSHLCAKINSINGTYHKEASVP